MKIWSYTFAFPDETDILANCLNSLSRCVDRIILVDGGMGHAFVHQARNTEPIRDWLRRQSEYDSIGCNGLTLDACWNSIPLILLENEYVDPGSQRNFVLQWIEKQTDKPDWIVALDADEVESTEAETGMRYFLEAQPALVTNVVQPLLNLVQDEEHCADGHHSTWLAHSRLHRPGVVHYNLGYHEHQTYQGMRVQWSARIIHQRMLYRRRIWLQRGAYTLRSAWDDVKMVDIPSGVTWHSLEWPKDEPRNFPFDEDIRTYKDGLYAR